MLNKIVIVGNLTKDPEMRYTPSGTAVCNLGLACNHSYKAKNGEVKKEVCFITVVVWGKRAENCNQYLHKGEPVFIDGRLQSRSWEAQDGTKRYATEIVAENIQFLNRTKEGTSPEKEEDSWINEE